VIERGVALCQDAVLQLGLDLLPVERAAAVAAKSSDSGELTLAENEKQHILNVLRHTGCVIDGANGAAKILDLHPNTLRSRMKKLGIGKSDHEIS
jgi:transcriptional regulator with GAF, ATPase, and Fis domain